MSSVEAMTLAEFLFARIEDDERRAQRANPDTTSVRDAVFRSLDCYSGDVVLVAAMSPARVLAEVAAKRAILGDHLNANAYDGDDWDVTGDYALPPICSRCEQDHDAAPWPCPTLRALGLPYAEHPDYDNAWRLP